MGFAFDKPLVWIIILVIVLLVFGAGKLPDIGRSLGKSIKEFKDETTNGLAGTASTVPSVPGTSPVSKIETGTVQPTETTIRRRIIKHPDGREEIIEEQVPAK